MSIHVFHISKYCASKLRAAKHPWSPKHKAKGRSRREVVTVKCSRMQLTERVTCWACRMGARGLGCPPLQMCYVESKDSTSFRLCRKGNVREKCWSSSNPSSPLKTITFSDTLIPDIHWMVPGTLYSSGKWPMLQRRAETSTVLWQRNCFSWVLLLP